MDSYRITHPQEKTFTCQTAITNGRKAVSRIDQIYISPNLITTLKDSYIHSNETTSEISKTTNHRLIGITISLQSQNIQPPKNKIRNPRVKIDVVTATHQLKYNKKFNIIESGGRNEIEWLLVNSESTQQGLDNATEYLQNLIIEAAKECLPLTNRKS